MAKIIDPDNLNRGTEVIFNTTALTVQLAVAGSLSTDGVALRCVYSFCREQWKSQADLIPYPFPLEPIDGPSGTQFLLANGWTWLDTTTTGLIRDGGWALVDASGTTLEEWMNITGLISFDDEANDTAFYKNNVAYVDFALAGKPNQAVQIYADGSYDYRGAFKAYIREYGKTLGGYDLVAAQNITALTYKQYAIPLGDAADIYVVDDYATAGAITGIAVDYGASAITISANVTAQNIYDYTSWWLVQSGNEEYGQFFSTFDGNNYNIPNEWKLHLTNIINGGISVVGNVYLDVSQDLANFTINGNLHITTGADSALNFSGVTVTGDVLNDSESNTLVIYSRDGSSLTTSEAGAGNGRVDIIAGLSKLTITFVDANNNLITGYEWRIYEADADIGVIGLIELDGEEVATSSVQQYSYSYESRKAIVVQAINQPIYEEQNYELFLEDYDQNITIKFNTQGNI